MRGLRESTLVVVLVIGGASHCRALGNPELLGTSWDKQSAESLNRFLPDLKAAQQFVSGLWAEDPKVDIEDLKLNPPKVVDYRFADLKGDGTLQLVCLLDYTGRGRATELMAVENHQGQVETAYLSAGEGGLGIGKLSEIIKDINHDGMEEILISYALEPLKSAVVPTPHLEHVYIYKSGKFLRSDSVFPYYYAKEALSERREEWKTLAESGPPEGTDRMEQVRYQQNLRAKRIEITALVKIVKSFELGK